MVLHSYENRSGSEATGSRDSGRTRGRRRRIIRSDKSSNEPSADVGDGGGRDTRRRSPRRRGQTPVGGYCDANIVDAPRPLSGERVKRGIPRDSPAVRAAEGAGGRKRDWREALPPRVPRARAFDQEVSECSRRRFTGI